jgi:hypothetical protein
VKTGYQPGRKKLVKRADKDNWLLNKGFGWGWAGTQRYKYGVTGDTWWFLPSAVTKQGGSSKSFFDRLSNDGINIMWFIYKKGQNDKRYNNNTSGNYAMFYAAESHSKIHRVYKYYPSNGGNTEDGCPTGDYWVSA